MDEGPKILSNSNDSLQSTIVKWAWDNMSSLSKRDFITNAIDEIFEYNEKKLKDLRKLLKEYIEDYEYDEWENTRSISLYLKNNITIFCQFKLVCYTFNHEIQITKSGEVWLDTIIDVFDDLQMMVPKETTECFDGKTEGKFSKVMEIITDFYCEYY